MNLNMANVSSQRLLCLILPAGGSIAPLTYGITGNHHQRKKPAGWLASVNKSEVVICKTVEKRFTLIINYCKYYNMTDKPTLAEYLSNGVVPTRQ